MKWLRLLNDKGMQTMMNTLTITLSILHKKIVNKALEQFDGGLQIEERKRTNLKFVEDLGLIDKIISILQNLRQGEQQKKQVWDENQQEEYRNNDLLP